MKWLHLDLRSVAEINPRDSALRDTPDDLPVTFVPMSSVSEETATIERPQARRLGDVRRGFTPFQERDVLVAKITPCMENGKAALAQGLLNGLGFGSTEFHVIRASTAILPEFILYFIRQESWRRRARSVMSGAVGQQRVPADFIAATRIPLPPPSEQRRIVELLDQADALRKKRAEADKLADRILPALFLKMFGDPATNPKGWPVCTLDDLIADTDYGTSERADSDVDGVPVIRMNNILRNGRLDLSELKYAKLTPEDLIKYGLRPGDLVFNRTNSRELVGKTGLWDQPRGAVAASYLIRVRIREDKASPTFVWALMNSNFMKQRLFDKARHAIGMANINSRELRSLPAYRPPVSAQTKFAAEHRQLMTSDLSRSGSCNALTKLFGSMLHRAFSGDLTAKWREAHMKELLQEMEQQAKQLKVAHGDHG